MKSSPANAGDTLWIPGLGRSLISQGNQVRVPQLLSRVLGPVRDATEAHVLRARGLKQEKPPLGEACTWQPRVALACCN